MMDTGSPSKWERGQLWEVTRQDICSCWIGGGTSVIITILYLLILRWLTSHNFQDMFWWKDLKRWDLWSKTWWSILWERRRTRKAGIQLFFVIYKTLLLNILNSNLHEKLNPRNFKDRKNNQQAIRTFTHVYIYFHKQLCCIKFSLSWSKVQMESTELLSAKWLGKKFEIGVPGKKL